MEENKENLPSDLCVLCHFHVDTKTERSTNIKKVLDHHVNELDNNKINRAA